jgi:hypothetical protein
MQLEMIDPARRGDAATGSGRNSLAAILPEYHTPALIINRLRSRFGFTEPVAALIASLASIGPKEGR